MTLEINLRTKTSRIFFGLICVVFFAFLLKSIVVEFTIGTLTDERIAVPRGMLETAVALFPQSARISARLAELDAANNTDLQSAEKYISQAALLSPSNYRYQLILGKVREAAGNEAGAEEAFRTALKFAPNYAEVHRLLANCLIRQGKLEESYEYFRTAVSLDHAYLPVTFDLIWNASNGNVSLLKSLPFNDTADGKLKLALFMAKQSRAEESVEIFNQIEVEKTRRAPDSTVLINTLIDKGFPKAAFSIWQSLYKVGADTAETGIWDGGFENETALEKNAQAVPFNWQFKRSDYARFLVDSKTGRNGSNSMVISFAGRDTTRLNGDEAKQMIVLKPKTVYRLSFYVLAKNFQSPEGPQIVLSDLNKNLIAASEPISPEIQSWRKIEFNFTTPQSNGIENSAVLFFGIKRLPKYSYDEPTRGEIRLDDFAVSEVNGK